MPGGADFLEHAFEHTRAGMAIVDAAGVVLRANTAGASIIGRTAEEVTGLAFVDLIHADDLELALLELGRGMAQGHGGPAEIRVGRPDGTWVWVRAEATGLPTEPPTLFASFSDITAERAVVEKLRQADARASRRAGQQEAVALLGHDALAGMPLDELANRAAQLMATTIEAPYCGVLLDDGDPEGLLLVAACGHFTDAVGRYRQPRDAVAEVLDGSEPTVHAGEGSEQVEAWSELAAVGIRSMAIMPVVPRSGPPGLVVLGSEAAGELSGEDLSFLEAVANVIASAIDAAAAVDHLRHNALHDGLTGLPNRALVLDRLELALTAAAAAGTQVAVLVCDVDRFKVVNDGMGHAAGDAVLCAVAEQLRAQVRPGDTVGRFGGDEFVVVCPEVGDVDAVVAIAERLAEAVSEPVQVGSTELVATASIGIAVGSEPGEAAAAGLLRDADAAMYRAKARGRNRFELFDDAMRARADRRLRTETELRKALEREELLLHYQPVLDLATEEVVGVEALLRWQHPTRGLLEPEQFVEIAGDSGLVPRVGAWAFGEAARQTAAWVAAGSWGGRFTAVNLAPRQLSDRHLLERIDDALERTGCDPASLRIEITEEALVDSELAASSLIALRDRGLGISVDDFGTGYSSLAYLKRLPVDALKLDQGFVAGLGDDGDDMVIAAAVIVMAQALGLRVVAEGVETRPQLEVLRAMGCDLVQGYLFARPMPAAELEAWLADRAG
jgi:diguanylate cyclase (GGDEF)-like protein/PAS domain S-box-containing protein